VIRELLSAGLMHGDVMTVYGDEGLHSHTVRPVLNDAGQLAWQAQPALSTDTSVVRNVTEPFAATGGLRLLQGNLDCESIRSAGRSLDDHSTGQSI
jgi:phosphogluconate dehydratase